MDAKKFNRLLKKIRSSQKAFNEIYNFYYSRIIIHISRKFGKEIAQDVAQEFFVKLFKLDILEKVLYPTSWVYKICDNIALTYLKKFKSYEQMTENECYEFVSYNELNADLIHSLNQLDATNRKIIYLYYCEGYKLTEIAEILRLPYDTVRQRHSRGLKKLKKLLK